ncbi:GPI-anchored protein LORELEI-like [Panicum miliaceum]|uniref:GPI-anchored protein LORELEI-like n=1 Tax=Panicum miliaceum TaxID=4540 RepID=A0A3L6QDK1_PANMI|nr:GPI-anchored protein LORELEI-like [Panicum miliaceum]
MAVDRGLLLLYLLSAAAALAGVASAAGPFLSDGVFQVTAGSTGRSLLQAKKDCPVSFEFQNYTIITSKCKGPKFPASQCCSALKEFACPFYMYLNDDSNSCASTMFTYINLYGKYPPGLFSSECKEGKLGLSCADVPQRDISTANGGQHAQHSLLGWITVMSVVVVSLFH